MEGRAWNRFERPSAHEAAASLGRLAVRDLKLPASGIGLLSGRRVDRWRFYRDFCGLRAWFFESGQDLLRQQLIGGGPAAVFVVVNDRFAEARRFREPGAPRDHRFKNPLAEMLPHLADN